VNGLRHDTKYADSSLSHIENNIPEGKRNELSTFIEQAPTQEEARRAVADSLKNKLSVALSMPPARIAIEKPTYAYGVDSLVAVEIRCWLLEEFNVQIAVFEILRSESITALCFLVASKDQYQRSWTEEPIEDYDGANTTSI
jgi:acyl carrier protein